MGGGIYLQREKIYAVLLKHVHSEQLLRHGAAVEIALRAYAEKFGADPDYWGAVGLLHDIDFEKYPNEHLKHSREILLSEGFAEQFVIDVISHDREWEKERSLLQKALLACDEMTGFVLACALVRPDKSLDALEVKSVVKKMKDKAFARAVSRELLAESAADLGVDLKEHIDFVRAALAAKVKDEPYAGLKFLG
ncbi:MAG: HD domain-containing protein [Acidaminococcales bacterium]|jgi:predicted hydrolase (HD superfamily)|nr:HD domain-containing protein [Acidaminococcales bacterium]